LTSGCLPVQLFIVGNVRTGAAKLLTDEMHSHTGKSGHAERASIATHVFGRPNTKKKLVSMSIMTKIRFVLPDTEIEMFLSGFGVGEPELVRFRSVFLSVWGKIPRGDRASIEDYWSSADPNSPPLELQEPWLGDPTAKATTESRGMDVKCDWKTCRLLPDAIMEVPVAHEMAHVFQWATNKNRFNMTPHDLLGIIDLLPFPRYENTLVEIHADEMITTWGFDPVVDHAYLYQHYDSKNGEFVPRKKLRDGRRAYKEVLRRLSLGRYRLSGN
jgi:hypothetical protein